MTAKSEWLFGNGNGKLSVQLLIDAKQSSPRHEGVYRNERNTVRQLESKWSRFNSAPPIREFVSNCSMPAFALAEH